MALIPFRVTVEGHLVETWEVDAHDMQDAATRVWAGEGTWMGAEWQGKPRITAKGKQAIENAERLAQEAAIARFRGDAPGSPIHASHQTRLEERGDIEVERCQICKATSIAVLFQPCPGVRR